MKRAVRPMLQAEIALVINYFLNADHEFLNAMGVDPVKLPKFDEWYALLKKDFERPMDKRHFFYVIWEIDDNPVGHSHIGDITYGQEAYMHLHLWYPEKRKQGNGSYFIVESIKQYFQSFSLNRLYCQPYSLNPAPNNTLAKVGFKFLEAYETIPSWINFHQAVNKWMLTRAEFEAMVAGKT